MQPEKTELYSVLTEGYQPPRQMLHITTGDPTPAFSLRWAEQMMNDPQVGLGMSINAAPIMKPKIELSGNTEIVKFVERTIRDIWLFMIPKVVLGYYTTVSGGEVIYEQDPDRRTCFKEYRDIHPNDLRILHSNHVYHGLRVQNGRQTSIKDQSQKDVILLGSKGFLYVHKRSYGSWEGKSDLRPAFKPWLSRADFNGADASARLWFYKNSFGGGTIYHPKGDYIDPRTNRRIPYREIALQMGTALTNGHVLAFESIVDPETKQPSWRYEPPALNGDGKPLLEDVDHLDVRIHRGMGIPDDILSQQSENGSGYAGRTIPMAVFVQGRNQVLRETFFAIKDQIIDPLVKLNYGPMATHKYDVEKIEVDMDALMPNRPDTQPAGPQPQQPGDEPLNLDEPEKPNPQEQPQQFGYDEDHPRAPKNGVVIKGKHYSGGEFIPSEVLADMTPEQKERLADAMEKNPHTPSQRSIIDININDTAHKGSTGDNKTDGTTFTKNAVGEEGAVYAALKGVIGIAAGREANGQIQVPHYPHIIGVDDIDPGKRKTVGPIVAKNADRIAAAIGALTAAGYIYNDPLQFGMSKDRQMDLLDFSMAEKSEDAFSENLNTLSNFYGTFGVPKLADAAGKASYLAGLVTSPDALELLGDDADAEAARSILKQFNGKPTHAYYSFNARTIPGVGQSGTADGKPNIIFTDSPLTPEKMSEWEIKPLSVPPAKSNAD